MKKGIDISNWQSGLQNYAALKADGIEFAILKISEGTGFRDMSFDRHYEGCRAAGIRVGAYIYSHAQTPEAVRAEVDYALKLLGGRVPELGLFLDMEAEDINKGWNRSVLPLALAFGEYAALKGLRWGIYANSSWWQYKLDAQAVRDAGGLVWAAEYNKSCRIAQADIWQYTSSGRAGSYDKVLDMDLMLTDFMETEAAEKEHAKNETDTVILVLQALLRAEGFETGTEGKSSAALVSALRSYADRLEGK